MRIDELDEWQGITPELVTDWLLANGWTQPNTSDLARWENGADVMLFDPSSFDQMPFWATTLSRVHGLNTQAVLRMVNPRMRGPGYPSDAAARAHGDNGWWVFQHQDKIDDPYTIPGELHMAQMCLSPAGNDVRFYWERGLMGEPCDEECLWWPCDANGNKVRWPTDAEGNML